jgi:putative YhbY family RNA-binding protein
MTETKRELQRRSSRIKPHLLVGKSQLTPGVIAELERIFESQELVKIRFLKSSDPGQRDQMISQLAKETQSELIETRGNTIALFRPHRGTAGKIYKDKSGGNARKTVHGPPSR